MNSSLSNELSLNLSDHLSINGLSNKKGIPKSCPQTANGSSFRTKKIRSDTIDNLYLQPIESTKKIDGSSRNLKKNSSVKLNNIYRTQLHFFVLINGHELLFI